MRLKTTLAAATVILSACAAQATDSVIVLGQSTFGAHCALCHGATGKGDGEIAQLFQVPPADLTKLAERSGGSFPFSEVYHIIIEGMQDRGHGSAEMPIWGDYFMTDALEDRGVSAGDAMEIAAGRVLSVVYYLESIQE